MKYQPSGNGEGKGALSGRLGRVDINETPYLNYRFDGFLNCNYRRS